MRPLRQLFLNWSHTAPKTRVIEANRGLADHGRPRAWRALYLAALFENEEEPRARRISEAKHALVARARELFLTSEDHMQEESAIDEALQALHALEQCGVHLCPHSHDSSQQVREHSA